MKNGNYIKGIPATENFRGYRMHVAYLEPGVRKLDIWPIIVTNFGHKKGEIYEGFYGG